MRDNTRTTTVFLDVDAAVVAISVVNGATKKVSGAAAVFLLGV